MLSRNDPCWCGSGKKWKKCHYPQLSNRDETSLAESYLKKYGIIIKSEKHIEGIRRAGHLAARILDLTCQMAKAGATTNELNDYADKLHRDVGAIPAPLHYGDPPYPKSICTSLNSVICHGIPDDVPLQEGDILNIDVTSILDGYYGDCSRMVAIGAIDSIKQLVYDVSYECLQRATALLKPGLPIYEIGNAIESHARSRGCSVVNQFVGHGVGIEFHEPPQVPHHYNHLSIPLAPGMIFTIEPMINAGVRSGYIDSKNHWTAYTSDGMPSAQYEYTLLITSDGYEILTPWQMG